MPAVTFTCVLNGFQYAPLGGPPEKRTGGVRFGTATGVMDSARGAPLEKRAARGAPPEKLTHHSRCTTREARGSRRTAGEAQGSRCTIEEALGPLGSGGGVRDGGGGLD